ncbi:DUF664 domain-containing protein [bacterium]|nr:MAG: DUF664 domain-containing protein [bacterium]
MSDFHTAWTISRGRFVAELEGLSHEQLSWRMHPGALTLAEAALHVAGVEVKFGSSLLGTVPQGEMARISAAATDGVVNDKPFPFGSEEMTPEFVAKALDEAKVLVEPTLLDPIPERREVSMVSALGPVITGEGALARLTFHAAYHQGQVYLIRHAPGFPS